MTTWMQQPNPYGGGGSSGGTTVVAEDILTSEGGVISKRGPISLIQNYENGYSIMRQHFGSGTHRPAQSLGSYPRALWMTGVGAEADGYGTLDSGGGTYLNLDRGREGVWQTQSWWWAPMGPKGALGTITFYVDTEGWGNTLRSYFAVEVDLQNRTLKIRPNNGGVQQVVATDVPVPEWNDNKFDRTYTSMTTFIGPSAATGTGFGRYGAFQIGSKVYDLRGVGGNANYPVSGIAQPGSGFAGGRNPGIGYTTPLPGICGGVAVFDFLETQGDTVASS